MRPLSNYLLIKPIEERQETESGIQIGFQEGQSQLIRQIYPDKAEVIKCGELVVNGICEGDKVVYARWGARDIGEGTYTIHQDDILLIIGD